MNYPLDHLLIAVKDLDIAAENWRGMGFNVSPRMHHSYGTSNNLIMFEDNFLELFGGMESVQGEFRDGFIEGMAQSLQRGEGVLASCFRPGDIEADREVLIQRGVSMSECGRFSRPVPLPDGARGEADISFTMSDFKAGPDLRLFFSQQHRPEVVWIPQWQQHANTAIRMTAVTYLLPNPQQHEPIFSAFTGSRPEADAGGLRYVTPSEEIHLLSSDGLAQRYGGVPGAIEAHFMGRAVAVEIGVSSLDEARRALLAGGHSPLQRSGRLTLSPTDTNGLIMVFHQASTHPEV